MTATESLRFAWVCRFVLTAAIASGMGGPVAAQRDGAKVPQTEEDPGAAPQQVSRPSGQPETSEVPQPARPESQASMPSLQQMLEIALKHNPDVRAAEAQLLVAEAELDRTRLDVVQKIVAYRDRWQTQRAAIDAAATRRSFLASHVQADAARADPELKTAIADAAQKLALQREKLREVEVELQFLLGRPLNRERAEATPEQSSARATLLRGTMRPLLKRLIEASIAEYDVGRGSLESIYEASYRLMEVERSLAATEAERIAAIETHRDRMQQLHKESKARFETGTVGQREALMTEVYVVEADLELLDERAND